VVRRNSASMYMYACVYACVRVYGTDVYVCAMGGRERGRDDEESAISVERGNVDRCRSR